MEIFCVSVDLWTGLKKAELDGAFCQRVGCNAYSNEIMVSQKRVESQWR